MVHYTELSIGQIDGGTVQIENCKQMINQSSMLVCSDATERWNCVRSFCFSLFIEPCAPQLCINSDIGQNHVVI